MWKYSADCRRTIGWPRIPRSAVCYSRAIAPGQAGSRSRWKRLKYVWARTQSRSPETGSLENIRGDFFLFAAREGEKNTKRNTGQYVCFHRSKSRALLRNRGDRSRPNKNYAICKTFVRAFGARSRTFPNLSFRIFSISNCRLINLVPRYLISLKL